MQQRSVTVGIDKPHITLNSGTWWCVQLVPFRRGPRYKSGSGETPTAAWIIFEFRPVLTHAEELP